MQGDCWSKSPVLRIALLATVFLFSCSNMPPPSPDGGADAGAPKIDLSRSTFTVGSTADVVANGSTQLTFKATIRNTEDQPLSGTNVTFTATGTGNQLAAPPSTDQNGELSGFMTSTHAEQKQLTASLMIDGAMVSFPAITVNFVAGPADHFVFATQPSTTKAGVTMTPPVTLTVLDSHENVAKDPFAVSVRLVRSNSGTLTGGGPVTSVNGVVTFDMLSVNRPQVGRALRAEASNGAAIESDLFDIILGDISSATSTFVATPPNSIADGTSVVTLTFTARDTGGNTLANLPVSLVITGTGNTLGATSGLTDLNGVFTTTLTSTVPETKTVTATVNSVPMQLMVTFIP